MVDNHTASEYYACKLNIFAYEHTMQFFFSWTWMKSLSGLHKGQLHISTNFQNINLFHVIVATAESVSFFTTDKHLIIIRTATNGDLKCTKTKMWTHISTPRCMNIDTILWSKISQPLLYCHTHCTLYRDHKVIRTRKFCPLSKGICPDRSSSPHFPSS